MKKALRVADYLGHILEAIEKIERYIGDDDERSYLENELLQDAVIRNIEVIGEASKNIGRVDKSFTGFHPGVPWEVMYAMRNQVAHGYHSVEHRTVWKTAKGDLPGLYEKVKAILAALPQEKLLPFIGRRSQNHPVGEEAPGHGVLQARSV
jgi:uncharacterized protein with HEPN domain